MRDGQFMIGRMRLVVIPWLCALAVPAGCAGVSTDPEAMAARELPAAGPGVDAAAVATDETEALRLLAAESYSEAVETARSVLERDPRRARARSVFALALLRSSPEQGPAPMAIQSAADGESLTALRLAPADPVVGLVRGRVLAEIGHLSAAATAAEDCLKLSAATDLPEFLDLLAATAEWAHELGEDRRALVHLRELASRRPSDSLAHYRLGTCLLRIASNGDDAAAASRAFARCAELEPESQDTRAAVVAALVRAAELYESDGEAEKARAQLVAAASAATLIKERFPNSAAAAFQLAAVCELQGELKQAVEAYEGALQLDAEHLPSLLNLLSCATRQRDAYAEICRSAPRMPTQSTLLDRTLAVDAAKGGLSDAERTKLEKLRASLR